MANTRTRIGAIRAGSAMAAPGQPTNIYGTGQPSTNGASMPMTGSVSGSVGADASVQATGILVIILVALVILGERLGR